MREVITYVAYDDTEFDNSEDCENYERGAFDALTEVFDSYRFFIDNGQEISIFLNGIEEGLDTLAYALNKCTRIQVTKTISEKSDNFIKENLNFNMPANEVGVYEYLIYTGWVKVNE